MTTLKVMLGLTVGCYGDLFPRPEPMHIATDDLMPQVPGFYWLFRKPDSTVFNCVTAGDPPTTPASVAKRMAIEFTEHWINEWRKRI